LCESRKILSNNAHQGFYCDPKNWLNCSYYWCSFNFYMYFLLRSKDLPPFFKFPVLPFLVRTLVVLLMIIKELQELDVQIYLNGHKIKHPQ
jgi:hypothetical protein